ncbi:MAG: type VI secretion system tip protein TssI/VgrG [Polyangiaceae bacterium]
MSAGAASLNAELEIDGLPDGCLVAVATVREAISEPTHASVVVLATDDVDLAGLVGKPAHLTLEIQALTPRHFHLVVAAARFEGIQAGPHAFRRYVVELTHELSLLQYRSDVRMFQEKDAKEIVVEVLEAAGVPSADVTFSLGRSLSKRVYCIQYRETDFNFASRLLEHEGIFYFIHDDEGGTHITFADDQSAFLAVEGETCDVWDGHAAEAVRDFWLEDRAAPGLAVVCDYNFETPQIDLTSSHQGDASQGEVFEYAAGHATTAEGAALAEIRCQERRAQSVIGQGMSNYLSFTAGKTFELQGALAAHQNQEYLLTHVTHRAVVHGPAADAASYENDFTAIPKSIAFRPARRARRPRLRGVHSAVVTGPGGEIHTDNFGRMKGKFFWDRVNPEDDTSSCWMRVTQLPISGSMALARMTWEMGIAYFDGDPDRPIAITRLYNGEKVSPYGYPAAKTRMAFQTPSSPASGKSNEIRLEDGGGGQEFFVNASKDYDGAVINNKTEDVGVDETVDVGVDTKIDVGASQTVSIGANHTETVSSNQAVGVTGDRSVSIGASETVTVSGNITQAINGSDTETTGGSHTSLAALGVDKNSSSSFALTVGGSKIQASALGVAVAVAGAKAETVGGAKIFASGKTVTESVVGAYACTVGGAVVHAAANNRLGSTKGVAAITVGGLAACNAAGKVSFKAPKINIMVGGVANLLGGGGILNLTPASATFTGIVTLDASGKIKLSGNPNLVG